MWVGFNSLDDFFADVFLYGEMKRSFPQRPTDGVDGDAALNQKLNNVELKFQKMTLMMWKVKMTKCIVRKTAYVVWFLDVSSHIYERVLLSVRLSVSQSVTVLFLRKSDRLVWFMYSPKFVIAYMCHIYSTKLGMSNDHWNGRSPHLPSTPYLILLFLISSSAPSPHKLWHKHTKHVFQRSPSLSLSVSLTLSLS